MADKKEDTGDMSYVFGIISIVLAFFTPLAGLIFGIIGNVLGKKQNTPLAKKGKKLSTIGIVIGVIVLIITIVVSLIYNKNLSTGFPVQ